VSKRVFLAVVVLAFAAVGCGGGDDSKASDSPKPSASKGYSKEAETCFSGVIKAVDKALEDSQGTPTDIMTDEDFAAFEESARGKPVGDIYKEYRDMGLKDLANGTHATPTDALAAYAPSVKLECTQQYG
jgi:hypothetical protein